MGRYRHFIIFTLLVLLYIFRLLFFANYTYSFLLKLLPTIYTLYLLLKNSFKNSSLLVISLLTSMLGDLFLDLNPELFFVYGLISFAIAHIVFIIYFTINYQFCFENIIIKTLPLSIFALFIAWSFRVAPEDLLIPVWLYIGVIFLLAIVVFIKEDTDKYIKIGVISFIISDIVIAYDKFIYSFSLVLVVNSVLYFPALFLIIYGSILDKKVKPSF